MTAAFLSIIGRVKFQILQDSGLVLDFSGYYVFGRLKDTLKGQRFGNNDEIKELVHSWRSQKYFGIKCE